MCSENREAVVNNSSSTATHRSLKSARVLAFAVSLLALAIVACSSSEDPVSTATSQPDPTKIPVATTAPIATATTAPETGGGTPLEPTEVPVKAPDPTAVPPTVVPTATPDPLVTLSSIVLGVIDSNKYPQVPPGDGILLKRLFPDAPPYAPHMVDDIKITVDRNKCATCHQYGLTVGASIAVPIPESHFTDQLTGEVSEELDPRRYICTTCHVPQVTDPLPWAE